MHRYVAPSPPTNACLVPWGPELMTIHGEPTQSGTGRDERQAVPTACQDPVTHGCGFSTR